MGVILRGLLSLFVLSAFSVAPAAASSVAIYGVTSNQTGLDDVKASVEGAGVFDAVDAVRIDGSSLDPIDLAAYDAVLLYTDATVANPQAIGDALADYVDAGGGLVVAMTSYDPTAGFGVGGRVVADGYLPFALGPFAQSATQLSLVALDPSHPLLYGVNVVNGGVRNDHHDMDFAQSASQVADWSNGEPLAGVVTPSSAGTVVGLNLYPLSRNAFNGSWDRDETDNDLLIANALAYAAEPGLRAVMRNQLRQSQQAAEDAVDEFCGGPRERPNDAFYDGFCGERR